MAGQVTAVRCEVETAMLIAVKKEGSSGSDSLEKRHGGVAVSLSVGDVSPVQHRHDWAFVYTRL